MTLEKPGPGRVFLSRPATVEEGDGARRLAGPLPVWAKLVALSLLLLTLAPGGALVAVQEVPAAAAGTSQKSTQAGKKPLHGQPWAFGQSEDRKDAIWRRGVPAQALKQRAVGATGRAPTNGAGKKAGGGTTAAAKGATGKGPASKGAIGNGAMDTEGSIDSALSAARAAAQAGGEGVGSARAVKPKGSLGLSMENETTTWNVTPMREAMRPDEVLARDSRHVVRAFADVEPTDDLSISVGPELILKDEQHAAESAGSSQPDSALGLGMQFKLDF